MSNPHYLVAVKSGKSTLYAIDGSGEGWTDIRGAVPPLDSTSRDAAVSAAVSAGLPYDVIEIERGAPGTASWTERRIAGTVQLVKVRG